MRYLKPIPKRLLPDDMLVWPALGDGTFGDCRMVRHVRWEFEQGSVDDEHRSADAGHGAIYVDAVNSQGAFEVPAGSRVLVDAGPSVFVKSCKRCCVGARRCAPLEAGGGLMAAVEDWKAAGGDACEIVARAVQRAGYDNVFTSPPATLMCAAPIVVMSGAWRRVSLQSDGTERGERELVVRVCCEDADDAKATCHSVERDLRLMTWTGANTGWHCRVAAVDTHGSEPCGRDGSGRWAWGFSVTATVVRGL